MDNQPSKTSLYAALLCVMTLILVIVFAIGQYSASKAPVAGNGGFALGECNFDGTTGPGPTTTPKFLQTTDTASTTITCYIANSESVDLNLMYNASSSSSQLDWQCAFSPNAIDWYFETGSNVSSNILDTHGPTPLLHVWIPGSSGTFLKNVGLSPTAEKYVQCGFKTIGANGSLTGAIITKNIIAN